MSKQTRREKAELLLERAKNGPSFSIGFPQRASLTGAEANKEATDSYRRWSETWLVPLLYDLVPELKGQDKIEDALERARKGGR